MLSSSPQDLHLPDLRFVPTESLVPHEQHDDQRMQPLVERFREQAVLKNPPIVTPLAAEGGNGRYMVLDGANRSSAARAAGFPHIVVQVVRYDDEGVELGTWIHALEDFPREELESDLAKIPGLSCEYTTLLRARAQLARREALACVRYADGTVVTLHGGHGLVERNALLNAVVDVYRHQTRFQRVTGDSVDQATRAASGRDRARRVPALRARRDPRARDQRRAAARRDLPPPDPLAGAARQRPDGVDEGHAADDRAEERVAARIGSRRSVASRHVRFYEEPTVLFDE